MSKLPVVTAKELEKLLLRIGFVKIRQKGSHAFYRHSDGRYTTLPHHAGEDLSRSLIRQILREIRITPKEFNSLLRKL